MISSSMKVALVYNKPHVDESDVINVFGMLTQEHYSYKTVEKVAKSLEKAGHTVKIIVGGNEFHRGHEGFYAQRPFRGKARHGL